MLQFEEFCEQLEELTDEAENAVASIEKALSQLGSTERTLKRVSHEIFMLLPSEIQAKHDDLLPDMSFTGKATT